MTYVVDPIVDERRDTHHVVFGATVIPIEWDMDGDRHFCERVWRQKCLDYIWREVLHGDQ